MFPSSFWKLVSILRPIMERDTAGSEWKGSAWNRVITASQRLSMGLCFFAGGSVYDIAGNHGVCFEKFIKVCMWSSMPLIPVNALTFYFLRVKMSSRNLQMDFG